MILESYETALCLILATIFSLDLDYKQRQLVRDWKT